MIFEKKIKVKDTYAKKNSIDVDRNLKYFLSEKPNIINKLKQPEIGALQAMLGVDSDNYRVKICIYGKSMDVVSLIVSKIFYSFMRNDNEKNIDC